MNDTEDQQDESMETNADDRSGLIQINVEDKDNKTNENFAKFSPS